jgi:hypothetical protein
MPVDILVGNKVARRKIGAYAAIAMAQFYCETPDKGMDGHGSSEGD